MSSLVQQKWISSARPASSLGGGDRGEAALEEVLDGLDVVQRLALDRRELLDLGGAEVVDDLAQLGLLVVGQRADPGDDLVGGQPDQPLDLDADAGPVEGGLGQVVDQRRDDAAVATVEGAEGDGGGRVSERSHGCSLPECGHPSAHPSSRAASGCATYGGRHALHHPRIQRHRRLHPVPRHDDLRGGGRRSHLRHHHRGLRRGGRHVPRHGRRLLLRCLRGDHRTLAQGPPRRRQEPRSRHQGPLPDGEGAQRRRPLAPPPAPGPGRLPDPARRRPHRPLPDARLGRGDPDRGDPALPRRRRAAPARSATTASPTTWATRSPRPCTPRASTAGRRR